MSDPTPEPTEERRPTSDSFRQAFLDVMDVLEDHIGHGEDLDLDRIAELSKRGDALLFAERGTPLLAAEPEHLPTAEAFKRIAEWQAIYDHGVVMAGGQPDGVSKDDVIREAASVIADVIAVWNDLRPSAQAIVTARPEHLPVFHVVEGHSTLDLVERNFETGETKMIRPQGTPHWHVRVVARNGKTLLSSENYTERRGAVEDAHDLADAMGARVVDDATGEDV